MMQLVMRDGDVYDSAQDPIMGKYAPGAVRKRAVIFGKTQGLRRLDLFRLTYKAGGAYPPHEYRTKPYPSAIFAYEQIFIMLQGECVKIYGGRHHLLKKWSVAAQPEAPKDYGGTIYPTISKDTPEEVIFHAPPLTTAFLKEHAEDLKSSALDWNPPPLRPEDPAAIGGTPRYVFNEGEGEPIDLPVGAARLVVSQKQRLMRMCLLRYEFPPGSFIPPHKHITKPPPSEIFGVEEVFVLTHGKVKINLGGQLYTVTPISYICVPEAVEVSLEVLDEESCKMYACYAPQLTEGYIREFVDTYGML